MILKTKRLILRELHANDFQDLCDMLCDEETMYAYAHAFCLEEVQEWYNKQVIRYQQDGVGLWAMIRKEDGVMVGQCGITRQNLHEEDVWEIGYLLKKEFWHQGYAIEAAKACKWYAFDTMKIPCIYSIIRNDNETSKKVALNNHMNVVDHVVKHYYHMDMPHDVYCVVNQKYEVEPMYHVYIDAEFDAVKINRKFHQMVISIGAVMCDKNGIELERFYETVHPQHFQRLTRVVHRMTKLDNDVIRTSRSLGEVMQSFSAWIRGLHSKRKEIKMYSFGPDDKRTIMRHCILEQVDTKETFYEVIDLQNMISPQINYQGQVISRTLSLDDMKLIYQIHGEVEHNALNDAVDLMHIHQAYKLGYVQNEKSKQMIVERKLQKQMESKRKQQAHFTRVMRERFKDVEKKVQVPFYVDIFDQFRSWEAKDEAFKWHFKKEFIIVDGIEYSYVDCSLFLSLDLESEIPSVSLSITCKEHVMTKKYVLRYYNATPIENIMKRGYANDEK